MRRMIEEVDTETETSFLEHEAPWENKGKLNIERKISIVIIVFI